MVWMRERVGSQLKRMAIDSKTSSHLFSIWVVSLMKMEAAQAISTDGVMN